ncbi:MAG: hypothetical protein KF902_14195 [Phycisphaeraceae bacterium]|nr:hypothetical protein [Phycisphaeraceae bacterium]
MVEKAFGWRVALIRRMGRVVLLIASAVLLFAGVTKAEAPQEFRDAIVRHELLSSGVAAAMSMLVPWLEIGLGAGGIVAAMCARGSRAAALSIGAAFLAFSVYALLISFDPPESPVPCGCLASGKPVESWFGVAAFNGAVATLMCLGAITQRGAAAPVARVTR